MLATVLYLNTNLDLFAEDDEELANLSFTTCLIYLLFSLQQTPLNADIILAG